ncbi:MAG: type II toxin-antitoxin system Phd/YefM family antitoxin [Hydrococcus sp. C42_A2020_068]|uniref:type II toxin-antitoxin system Phd/YefM family antitoxin n=1 Tax=Pleurocapsa sp. PCC 7327 TaxID=118163 RepID=UPI00059BEFFE|nr:type II toxin-antitoxin system Phd/YefM family antitoxin [Hydrococcus sp. C42_A2020_068]
MLKISVDEIQRNPLKYLHRVEAGESFIIVQADKPIAELKPITSTPLPKKLRPFGLCAGEFTVPNDFDTPLPEDILSAFES